MLILCFKQIFKDMHPTIAVSKKCCYCCNLLGIILNSDRDVDHQWIQGSRATKVSLPVFDSYDSISDPTFL